MVILKSQKRKKVSAKKTMVRLFALCMVLCLVGTVSTDPQKDPLAQLRNAATAIESRFKSAEKDSSLGRGLEQGLVKEVKTDSEEFWDGIKNLKEADTANMNQEDGPFDAYSCCAMGIVDSVEMGTFDHYG